MMNVLVSACLLGNPCRYDGQSKPHPGLLALQDAVRFIPVCPELLGGLSVPRAASEIQNGGVFNREGKDVSAAFSLGAEKTLALAKQFDCRCAILKERSPSCGHSEIYDGTFSGNLVKGKGITAVRLEKNGILVFSENELSAFRDFLSGS